MGLGIPSQLVALLTFPGVILHVMFEQLSCRWRQVAIFDVCYFRFGSPPGYVIHEAPLNIHESLLIGLGPFFASSLLGALLAIPAIIPALQFRVTSPADYILAWMGISIASHSFPDADEARNLWHGLWNCKTSTSTRLFAAPLVGFLCIGALGNLFCVDLLYGIGVVIGIPYLLLATL